MQIESFRHGIRVLDLADVTQLDWHHGQILLHTDAITKIDYAVLIDFANTFQTTEIEIINDASNYFEALLVFLHHARKFGLLDRQILDYFGKPDYWDSVCGITRLMVVNLLSWKLPRCFLISRLSNSASLYGY